MPKTEQTITTDAATPPFQEHYVESVRRLRGALTEAYQATGVDPASPREASRQLKLDKTLSWKLSRIINEDVPARVASSIPGTAGIRIAIDALSAAGADPAAIARLREAFEGFDRMVEVHSGDKAKLELMLDSMASVGTDRLEKSRKLAYQGNSGIWGVQAGVRLACHMLAPNADDPTLLDYAQIAGYTNFQRLRPSTGWPVLPLRGFNDDGSPAGMSLTPIETGGDDDLPLLLRDFSKGDLSQLRLNLDERGVVYELAEGPVGRTGRFSPYFGYVDRGALTRYRDEHNHLGELLCIITSPIETLVFDLLVHRDLAAQIEPPRPLVYGRASGVMDEHEIRDERNLLPIKEGLRGLGMGLPSLAVPFVPGYVDLGRHVISTLGWNIEEFTGWRLLLPYPPLPSTAAVQFNLPSAPA